jgi:hypothetical protein
MKQTSCHAKKLRPGIVAVALQLAFMLMPGGIAGSEARQVEPVQPFKPGASDVILPKGFPPMGKWMISPRLAYADWLGTTFDGKRLREPVNVIIVDPFAGSPEDATRRFLAACVKAGYSSRPGHSGGYFGWLGDRLFAQIPAENHHALSNEPFELHNNHGRFFGPYLWNGQYFFIGALSREKFVLATKAEHQYISFSQARDSFARVLMEKGCFKITAFLNMENALLDDPVTGTGDHDGIAVVLTAIR